MTTTREMVLVGGVAAALRERGSWTGETHVQKAAFVAKVLKHVPFESEFVLYKHGPFSFDLNKSLVHMRARGILSLTQNPGYGPSFEVNRPLWNALNQAAGNVFRQYSEGIDVICDTLATKNVAELERIATAIFLSVSHSDWSREELAEELVRVKPHIPPELARHAFDEAAQLA